MSEIVLNYMTRVLHGEATGQTFEISGYTEKSSLEVYLDGKRLSQEDYMVSNNQDCIIFDISFTTGFTGREELPVEIHIITQEETDEGENDSDTGIYYPKNYSEMADVPKDLKRMAISIDDLKQDKLIAGSNITIEGNVISATGGSLAEETDPTVPAWAKEPSKPSYTASEVGALPADTELFSGDYEDLRNKPELPSIEGLATEEYVNSKIGDIDTILSKIADESEAI